MTFDPEPTNPFGCFGMLIFGVLMLFFGFTTAYETPPPSSGSAPITAPASALPAPAQQLSVDTFEWAVRESFPPQVNLVVHGYWPDGCDVAPETTVERVDRVVYVRISRVVPPDMICAQMLQAFTTEVSITDALRDGDTFHFGEYTIDVNGVEKVIRF